MHAWETVNLYIVGATLYVNLTVSGVVFDQSKLVQNNSDSLFKVNYFFLNYVYQKIGECHTVKWKIFALSNVRRISR